MRYLMGMLVCLSLVIGGCQLHPPEPQESQAQSKTVTLDDLSNTDKMVMTTKMSSDLPNSWEYDNDVAKEKIAKLLPVLKKGTPLPSSAAVKTVPEVSFEVRYGGSMKLINVFSDRYTFEGNWYHLDNAPIVTYSALEKLEDKKQ